MCKSTTYIGTEKKAREIKKEKEVDMERREFAVYIPSLATVFVYIAQVQVFSPTKVAHSNLIIIAKGATC